MPYELCDLVVDRVDFVDEGANSAAFIELYKRKERHTPMNFEQILDSLKPEHAEVVKGVIAKKDADLATANQKLEDATAEIGILKSKVPAETAEPTEEDILKGMPEPARELFLKMRTQRDAAEATVRKDAEEKAEATAVAKAASLKAIPVEQAKLVGILKGCSPEVEEVLKAANAAIETAVLGEVGKNRGNGANTGTSASSDEAWNKLEKKAEEIAKRDNVTKEKAMSTALSENPELYREYLNGGAN